MCSDCRSNVRYHCIRGRSRWSLRGYGWRFFLFPNSNPLFSCVFSITGLLCSAIGWFIRISRSGWMYVPWTFHGRVAKFLTTLAKVRVLFISYRDCGTIFGSFIHDKCFLVLTEIEFHQHLSKMQHVSIPCSFINGNNWADYRGYNIDNWLIEVFRWQLINADPHMHDWRVYLVGLNSGVQRCTLTAPNLKFQILLVKRHSLSIWLSIWII